MAFLILSQPISEIQTEFFQLYWLTLRATLRDFNYVNQFQVSISNDDIGAVPDSPLGTLGTGQGPRACRGPRVPFDTPNT